MVCHQHTITIILIYLISHADTSQRLISVLPMHCIIQDCAVDASKTHDYRSNLEFIAKGDGDDMAIMLEDGLVGVGLPVFQAGCWEGVGVLS